MTRRGSVFLATSCLAVAALAAALWQGGARLSPIAVEATATAASTSPPAQDATPDTAAHNPGASSTGASSTGTSSAGTSSTGAPSLAAPDPTPPAVDDELLPVPPLPPRIAEGEDYDKCLGMLTTDPDGANNFADAWEATGGGDAAAHCHGLAQVALGNPADGAAILDKLAANSTGPAAGRAAVYGQASQSWLMAGDAARAYAAATLALSLSPDDPDLLIGRSAASATLEHYQDVVDDLDHALAQDAKRADALIYRAAAWRHLGAMTKAADDIEQATALDPNDPDALLERGIIRQRAGDLSGARRDWQQTMALVPDTPTGDLAQQNLDLLAAGPQQ